MNRIALFVLIATLLCTNALAETLRDDDAIRRLADSVMKSVGSNDLKTAFDKMKPFTLFPSAEIDSAYLQHRASETRLVTDMGNQ